MEDCARFGWNGTQVKQDLEGLLAYLVSERYIGVLLPEAKPEIRLIVKNGCMTHNIARRAVYLKSALKLSVHNPAACVRRLAKAWEVSLETIMTVPLSSPQLPSAV